jgi:hypothetical protein
MANFLVTEIIDATAVRVAPKWKFTHGDIEIIDDRVKICGLNAIPNDPYVKQRLVSFLTNREVELINPKLLSTDINEIRVMCNVILEGTDITYYFPEISNLSTVG